MLYSFLKHLIVGPLVNLLFRPRVVGREFIPASGPAIFVSNHPSFLDPVFLAVVLRRPISFLAKSEYFTGTGLKGDLTRRFFLGIRQLPIDRSGGRASEASLDSGLQHLADGGQLGLYPEGTRSPDGRVHRGRTGIGRLVLATDVPVIPVAMIDTDKVMPLGSKVPKIHRIGVVFGAPLDFSDTPRDLGDPTALRAITDRIMQRLSQLAGREYVDEYASVVRSRTR